jgi:hypothetical protein
MEEHQKITNHYLWLYVQLVGLSTVYCSLYVVITKDALIRNHVTVLQSYMDPLEVIPDSFSQTYLTSGGECGAGSMKTEDSRDSDAKEGVIPVATVCPATKAGEDQVSYVCLCVHC